MKPIHTQGYSVTDDGILFDGFFVRKVMFGGFQLAWTSGFTQIQQNKTFTSIEALECFLSINEKSLVNFKKVKRHLINMKAV